MVLCFESVICQKGFVGRYVNVNANKFYCASFFRDVGTRDRRVTPENCVTTHVLPRKDGEVHQIRVYKVRRSLSSTV